MNASSWRKAADLVAQGTHANQQVQAAATADSSQLESFTLSSLSADDSSPPQVNYGTEHPSLRVHQGQVQPPHKKYKPLIHIVR